MAESKRKEYSEYAVQSAKTSDQICDWSFRKEWDVTGVEEPSNELLELARHYRGKSEKVRTEYASQSLGGFSTNIKNPPIERYKQNIKHMAKWMALGENRRLERVIPNNYKPPKNVTELKARLKKGESNFPNTDFSFWDLTGCPLMGCDLTGSNFRGTNLSDVNFFLADMQHCHFFGAKNIERAIFKRADLSYSDLEGTEKFPFDENRVLGITVPVGHNHAWLKLKSEYNYLSLVNMVLFSAIFYIPLVVSMFFWGMISRLQDSEATLKAMESAPYLSRFACDPERCSEETLFNAVTSTLPNSNLLLLILIFMLFYNVFRYVFTLRISNWRSNERNSYTPAAHSITDFMNGHRVIMGSKWVTRLAMAIYIFTLVNMRVDVPKFMMY